MPDNRDAIELEVQRRLADYLASAGVAQGRISLEVLYMLPPGFTRAYIRLFERALLEGVSGGGSGDPGRMPAKRRSKAGDMNTRSMKGEAGETKRYRTYWSIKDERAFRLKASVDRKLGRLARDVESELAGLDNGTERALTCGECRSELAALQEASGRKLLRHCPYCGERLAG